MFKRLNFFSRKLNRYIKHVQKHWFTALLGGVFAFAVGVQAMTWLISSATGALYQEFGWMDSEQKILDQIGPNVQIGYIKGVLGEPILRDGGEKYHEYVFKRKFGYVQAVTDENNRTVLYSVVDCRVNFKPTITVAGGSQVRLNGDTLKQKGDGRTYYSISGATADSYLIEGGYGGNPTNYQEYYVGATDSCGSLQASASTYDTLEEHKCTGSHLGLQGWSEPYCQYDINSPPIDNIRSKVKINTIVVTAPNVSLRDLSASMKFGPDRIQLRVLPNYDYEW